MTVGIIINPKLEIVKSWSIMLAAAFMLFLTSAVSSKSWGPEIGSKVPDFSVQNAEAKIDSDQLKGKMMLVKFWSSDDAQSRIDNKLYQQMAQKSDKEIVYIAVCKDREPELAREILKVDNLDSQSQYFAAEGGNHRIMDAFQVQEGNEAYLIDSDGKVIAKNPDEAILTML